MGVWGRRAGKLGDLVGRWVRLRQWGVRCVGVCGVAVARFSRALVWLGMGIVRRGGQA